MARKLTTVTRTGSRVDMLRGLAALLARKIEACDDDKLLASLAKQYRDTIREIEEIEGAENTDDEISSILSARAANGLPGAVRKDRA